ncbi:MAG: DNA polymerase I [Saprospirales bacterium]|nr:DNA polymerase I [Saprospirales bacterium]MBK7335956.1 DNA polymerase I [Saprospirales bacterium]
MSDKRLFLLDGHALVYRAHFSFIGRPLINSKGMNTSAVAGFVRTLWDLIRNEKPTHLAVSFDLPTPTFRHEIYPEYKANRDSQPEDISFALPYIQSILKGFKIPVVSVDGYEADDVIGTLAKQAEKEGYEVYMVTPDKDYGQLVSELCKMYKPSRQGNGIDIWGVKEVIENWGIRRPDQVIDILGLQGDAVDNIPGIPGIGPKTAAKLLEDYDTVENLIAHAAELKGKVKESVETYAEQALLSKRLATIDVEVPIRFDPDTYIIEPYDAPMLAEIFKELEFRTLARQILGEEDSPVPGPSSSGTQGSLFPEEPSPVQRHAPPPAHSMAEKTIADVPHTYHLADTPEKRESLIRLLAAQKAFCMDSETTGIDPNQAELVGLSFSIKPQEAWYVPIPENQDEARKILEEFRAVFENPAIEKIGQNIKYDAIVLKWYGFAIKGPIFDTMVAHYLLEPELRHGMDYLAETYLKYQPIPIEALIGKKAGGKQITMREAPIQDVVEYAAEDADITLQLKNYLAPRLEKENLEELYRTMEEPLIGVLVDMEYHGVNIDAGYLNDYSVELEKGIANLEQEIYRAAGLRFNIASPKQVGEVLFDRLKVPYRWKKTKTGQYSTDEDKLSELSHEHEAIELILNHRGLTKLKSTYVDALPKMVNPRTGRIHSSFNQALAATGRLSSNNPNLQNIPVRTPEGAKVREAFIPQDSDYLLLAADYSQIELRLIAEISGDEAMLEAFRSGHDIHRATAAGVFGVPFDEVTKEQRYRAKTVNFSIIYGAGAQNLSRQLEIGRAEAKDLIDNYFKQYKGLRAYMSQTVEEARKNGYVTTLMGRRRHLRDIDSRNAVIRAHSERNAINTPIQGTAADLIKMAMIGIHQLLVEGKYRTKMILQVHDELVFDAHKDEIEKLKPLIEEKMKYAIPNLKVPILVEMGVGKTWLEAH